MPAGLNLVSRVGQWLQEDLHKFSKFQRPSPLSPSTVFCTVQGMHYWSKVMTHIMCIYCSCYVCWHM